MYKKYPAWSDGKTRHPTATLQDETWRPGFFGAVSISSAPERHLSNAPLPPDYSAGCEGLAATSIRPSPGSNRVLVAKYRKARLHPIVERSR